MALKLPRLQRNVAVVGGDGTPLQAFQLWWQRTAEAIEAAIDDIVSILVRLGLVEVTADGALELAESAINPGGTIKDSKVLTESIIVDGVTERYFTQTLAPVTLPDGAETEIMSLAVTKVLSDSEMDLDVAIRLTSNDDIRGVYKLYRDGLAIDTFDPFMNGSGGTFRICLTFPFTESDIPAGAFSYSVSFERDGGASAVEARPGSSIRVKEIKR